MRYVLRLHNAEWKSSCLSSFQCLHSLEPGLREQRYEVDLLSCINEFAFVVTP